MNDNPFIQHYKTINTSELFDIIDNASDYQPLAVEAARCELENRQLTTEQFEAAKDEQNLRRLANADKQQKAKEIERTVKSIGLSLLDTFNPIKKDAPTTGKFIVLISFFLGGLFLYQLYKEFSMLKFMFTAGSADWDFSVALYFLPLFLALCASVLFWLRKKTGWILAAIFSSYKIAGTITMFAMEIHLKPSGMSSPDTIFPTTSPTSYITTFLVFSGLTLVLCKENIRETFKITKATIVTTNVIGVGIVLLIFLSF